MSSLVEFQIPSAFTANELLNHPDWMIDLTAEEIAEIDIALREHLGSNVEYQDITKSQFPLPCFSTKLSYVLDVIENGIGAVILRGLPVEKYASNHYLLMQKPRNNSSRRLECRWNVKESQTSSGNS